MTDSVEETGNIASSQAAVHRLSPLNAILKALNTALRTIIPLAILNLSLFDGNIIYGALGGIFLLVLIWGGAALMWWRFTYQIGEREIRIQSGVLSRNSRSIPLDRIQDVSIEQKLIARFLGLATVRLETGSGTKDDDTLDALTLSDAEALRDAVRDFKASKIAAEEAKPAESAHEKPPLFHMDNQRVFIAGLFNFSFFILALVGIFTQKLDFLLPDEFFNPKTWADRFDTRNVITHLNLTEAIFGAAGIIFSLLAIGILSGVARTFIREHGFRLDRIDGGFRRRRGLFTLTDMVMPVHRVQAAVLQTGPVRKAFGWYALKFQSLAQDGDNETDHNVAPCAHLDEIAPILAETKIKLPDDSVRFNAVDPAMWWRRALFFALLVTILALAGSEYLHPAFAVLALVWPLVTGILYLEWHAHVYGYDNEQLFVRSGWWRKRLTIVPLRKVQTVDVMEQPLDHPFGLASLVIGLAGGSSVSPLTISTIPIDEAAMLRKMMLNRERY